MALVSKVEAVLRRQEAKRTTVQPDSFWPVAAGVTVGLLLAILVVIIGQSMVARNLQYDALLGPPTFRGVYANPLATLDWRVKCFARKFPVCRTTAGADALWRELTRYDFEMEFGALFCLFGGAFAGTAVRERRYRERSKTHGDAALATFEQIRDAGLIPGLTARGADPSKRKRVGVTFGVTRDRKNKPWYVRNDDGQPLSVVLIAPPGKGKSSCVYMPFLLTWTESAFVFDPSGELHRQTAGWRAAPRSQGGAGNIVLRFAPTQPSVSCHINPLDSVKWETEDEDATLTNVNKRLLDVHDKEEDGANAYWIATGSITADAVAAHLHYTEPENCNYTEVYNFLARFEDSPGNKISGIDLAMQEMMNADHRRGRTGPAFEWCDDDGNPTDVHPRIRRIALEIKQKAPNEKSGVIGTLRSRLHVFTDRKVAAVTKRSSFSWEDLMMNDKPVTLYFCLPPRDAQRLRSLQALLLNLSVFAHMGDDALDEETGEFRYRHPCAHCVDEAKDLKRQESYFNQLAMVRKYGMFSILGYQDVSQIWAAAGGEHEEAVMSTMEFKWFTRPNKPETADWLSHKVLGHVTAEDVTRQYSGNRMGFLNHVNVSRSLTQQELFSPQALMELPDGVAVVKAGSLPPFLVETAYYKNDPELKRRSEMPMPKVSAEIPFARRAYLAPYERDQVEAERRRSAGPASAAPAAAVAESRNRVPVAASVAASAPVIAQREEDANASLEPSTRSVDEGASSDPFEGFGAGEFDSFATDAEGSFAELNG